MTEGAEADIDIGPRINSIDRIIENLATENMDYLMSNGLPEDLQELTDIIQPSVKQEKQDQTQQEQKQTLQEQLILQQLQQRQLQLQQQQQQQQQIQQQQIQQQQQQQQNHASKVYLEIIEQPKQRGQRFRYLCEGRSAGSLPGEKSTQDKKSYPAVRICGYSGDAMIVVSLVTRDDPAKPHPHSLVGKGCSKGICTMKVSPDTNMIACFQNLGIQCVRKKDIQEALQKRKELGIDPFGTFQKGKPKFSIEDFELNVVRLCFQAFLPARDPQNPSQIKFTAPLSPIVSHPIHDKKGASLHISRVDRHSGSVHGGEDIFILCDKVQKDDIEVVFVDEDNNWEDNGKFGQSDVHRQVAIVAKTPPYMITNISEPVTVQMALRRPSDQEWSDFVDFVYTPAENDYQIIAAKRKRKQASFEKFATPAKQKALKNEPIPYHQASNYSTNESIGPVKPLDTKLLLKRKLERNTTVVKEERISRPPCAGNQTSRTAMLAGIESASSSSPSKSFSSVSSTNFGNTIVGLPQTITTANATITQTAYTQSATNIQYQEEVSSSDFKFDLNAVGLGVQTAPVAMAAEPIADLTANQMFFGLDDLQGDIMMENPSDSVHLPFCNSIELQTPEDLETVDISGILQDNIFRQ